MRTAQLGVAIMDARDGRLLIDHQADHEFAPASNFKLLDAATALAYLGPGFRYHTTLLARGATNGTRSPVISSLWAAATPCSAGAISAMPSQRSRRMA